MKRAIIAGAGPAGLTAAYQLLKTIPDLEVLLFEATNRIGGISTTIAYKGNRIDIGGHRFFSKSKKVTDLWAELLPTQGKPAKDDIALGRNVQLAAGDAADDIDPETTDKVMLIRNRVSRIFYRRKFFDYPISIKPATFINMGLINTLKSGCSYLYSSCKKREEKSLEDFYINRFGKQLYRMFFEDYTEKVWGRHPSRLAADWGAQRVKELSIITILREALHKLCNPEHKTDQTSLIERFSYPKFGPGQLWEIMAEKVRALGGKIQLNATLTGIELAGARVKAVVVNQAGANNTLACDYFLSTMPVQDLVAALDGDVPAPVRKIAADLPYRDFITVGLLLKKMRLKNETGGKTIGDIVPDCWIYIQERDVKIGRLQIFNNWSPYMVADYENTVWIGLEYFCQEGDAMWNMPEKDFIAFAIGELEKIGAIDSADVLDAVEVKIKKAYPAYFGSYSEFATVKNYLNTIDNLYCLGRNGQHKYNNMDHSMLTALEAAAIIKNGGGDKTAVWNVNTEKEYHEVK